MSEETPNGTDSKKTALSWDWPGKIPVANERGYFTGCAALKFNTCEAANAFFEANKGLLAAYPQFLPDGSLCVLVTKQLDGEEQEEFEHFQREMGWHMSEWRKKRDAAKQKERADKERELAENDRLMKLGKKCEADHGALIKERRKRNSE